MGARDRSEYELVGIIDPAPLTRAGFSRLLADSGFATKHVDSEPGEWAEAHDCSRLLTAVRNTPQWTAALQLPAAVPGGTIVAVVFDESACDFVAGSLAGLHAILPADTPPHAICDTFHATANGTVTLPRTAVLNLNLPQLPDSLSEEQVELLEAIASGSLITDIARRFHWSDTTARRRRDDLLRTLGVKNSHQAAAKAGMWRLPLGT